MVGNALHKDAPPNKGGREGGGGGRARSMPGTHHHPQPTSTTMITNLRAIRGLVLNQLYVYKQNIYRQNRVKCAMFCVIMRVKLTSFCKGFNCHLVNKSNMAHNLL